MNENVKNRNEFGKKGKKLKLYIKERCVLSSIHKKGKNDYILLTWKSKILSYYKFFLGNVTEIYIRKHKY